MKLRFSLYVSCALASALVLIFVTASQAGTAQAEKRQASGSPAAASHQAANATWSQGALAPDAENTHLGRYPVAFLEPSRTPPQVATATAAATAPESGSEPAQWAMLALGFVAIGLLRRPNADERRR